MDGQLGYENAGGARQWSPVTGDREASMPREILISARQLFTLAASEDPPLAPSEILGETICTLVSQGTEIRCANGDNFPVRPGVRHRLPRDSGETTRFLNGTRDTRRPAGPPRQFTPWRY